MSEVNVSNVETETIAIGQEMETEQNTQKVLFLRFEESIRESGNDTRVIKKLFVEVPVNGDLLPIELRPESEFRKSVLVSFIEKGETIPVILERKEFFSKKIKRLVSYLSLVAKVTINNVPDEIRLKIVTSQTSDRRNVSSAFELSFLCGYFGVSMPDPEENSYTKVY